MTSLHDFQDFVGTENFFQTCPAHAASAAREAQLNFWDLSRHQACCALCVASQPLTPYLQASRGAMLQGAGNAGARGAGSRF